jgi:hypothetical protein
MKSHFIDIDTVMSIDSKPWIIDKSMPNIPIMKIDIHDFNLFKSGIYRNQGNRISFNGKEFWLPNEFMSKLKVKAKKSKVDISRLAISLQEFMNKELVENINSNIDLSIFKNIINTNDDIYIICSKNKKEIFESQIKKLEEKLEEIGLKIKKYYFITETFYNKDEDEISYMKGKLILQHLLGLKTNGDIFTKESIEDYNQINYYDIDKNSIFTLKKINQILSKLLIKTDEDLKTLIKDKIKNNDILLIINEFTHNKANKFNEYNIQIEYSNVIKSFEGFRDSFYF